MLIELRCDKLIEKKLTFSKGLNTLIGPEDGTNSIGKSSTLMLIDFALSGEDFIKICSDVIENVGHIIIEIDFMFDKETYTFIRNTNSPDLVLCVNDGKNSEISIEEYRELLKNKYKFPENSSSFRSAVNTFSRIWGKDNYNPNKPLHSFPEEPYAPIKVRLYKLFQFYSEIKKITKVKNDTEKKKTILKGAFNEGYISSLTKKELKQSINRLAEVENQIDDIKKNIDLYTVNIKEIVNEKNIALKSKKDSLLNSIFHEKNKLDRVEKNLKSGKSSDSRYLRKIKQYFPNVDEEKLVKINNFHNGISKILKEELTAEKKKIEQTISLLDEDVKKINQEIILATGMLDKPDSLIEQMLELSVEEKKLRDTIKFRELKDTVDESVLNLSKQITEKSKQFLEKIETTININMFKYINKFYEGKPVSPQISLQDKRYSFKHNSDTGTGKSYANLIALDLSILHNTYLPLLIHDLIIFKNIEVHAIENILNEYSNSEKQIFIAIDELNRYSKKTRRLVENAMFIELNSDKLAFKKSWKSN